MTDGLRQMIVLLAVAMLVAMAARRLRLPYTVGLVLVGALLAFSPLAALPSLTSDLIFFLILPPLLFEAALALNWAELKREWAPLLAFSVLGTIVAAAFVAWGAHVLLFWPLPSALLFAALISATDPVAIVAMFKDNGLEGRLRLLVEAESLFNDAAAAVLFALALAFSRHEASGLGAAGVLAQSLGGGLLAGAAMGGAVIVAARRTSDHLVELTLTVLGAFGAFLVAEALGGSGVLATVVVGLILGHWASAAELDFLSAKAQTYLRDFWEFAAFLANSLIFLLMGAQVAAMPFQHFGARIFALAALLCLAARALAVYPLGWLLRGSRWRLSNAELHVMWWGGLRGALALALAQSLPAGLPKRDEIVAAAFAVVALSIIVQGLTMPPLLRRLGFLPPVGKRRP